MNNILCVWVLGKMNFGSWRGEEAEERETRSCKDIKRERETGDKVPLADGAQCRREKKDDFGITLRHLACGGDVTPLATNMGPPRGFTRCRLPLSSWLLSFACSCWACRCPPSDHPRDDHILTLGPLFVFFFNYFF